MLDQYLPATINNTLCNGSLPEEKICIGMPLSPNRLFQDQVPPVITVSHNSVSQREDLRHKAIDGGYGWVNVLCMQLLLANTLGVNGASRHPNPSPHMVSLTDSSPVVWCLPRILYQYGSFLRRHTIEIRHRRWSLALPSLLHCTSRDKVSQTFRLETYPFYRCHS